MPSGNHRSRPLMDPTAPHPGEIELAQARGPIELMAAAARRRDRRRRATPLTPGGPAWRRAGTAPPARPPAVGRLIGADSAATAAGALSVTAPRTCSA